MDFFCFSFSCFLNFLSFFFSAFSLFFLFLRAFFNAFPFSFLFEISSSEIDESVDDDEDDDDEEEEDEEEEDDDEEEDDEEEDDDEGEEATTFFFFTILWLGDADEDEDDDDEALLFLFFGRHRDRVRASSEQVIGSFSIVSCKRLGKHWSLASSRVSLAGVGIFFPPVKVDVIAAFPEVCLGSCWQQD